ncbi:MAG: Gfo/Idh/MocA family oxidoreductase [Acidobacteriota bacterium]
MRIRWGILGPGKIAHKFADALTVLEDHALVAVGGRDLSRASDFAQRYGDIRAYGSQESLLEDDEVDVVYIATPHSNHREAAIACSQAGKAVLCEKPLAVNRDQAEAMVAAARDADRFLMEAMWTRFLPVYADVRSWLAEGALGDPRLLQASFGFRTPWNPEGRVLAPELAGGALLDVGVYPVALALWIFGRPPTEIRALGHLGETGVDEQTGILLRFDRGELAILDCSVRTVTRHDAELFGTGGRLRIEKFSRATTAHLEAGDRRETRVRPFRANGFEYQAQEAGRCLRAGQLESPDMSHRMSVEIMAVMDEVRRQLGLRYPME